MDFCAHNDDFEDSIDTQYVIHRSLHEAFRKTLVTESMESTRLLSPEYEKIVAAIRVGDEKTLTKLSCHQFAFEEADDRGWTPLHEAVCQTDKNILEITFKSSGYSVWGQRTLKGETALFLAVESNKLENVNFLLSNSFDPDVQNDAGDSPLIAGSNVVAQASDSASILFEAASAGNPDSLSLLLEYGADANVPKHSGHLPIHRAAYRGHLLALKLLVPVTDYAAIKRSGISPIHSAAAGGHPQCLSFLLKSGFDVNFMLDQRVRKGYDDERKSALYFAVSNNDVTSAYLLLDAGALPNQDPVNCLQVALRMGNYELVNLLLRHGANVNYVCKVNPLHFPSALQYALKDEVLLRMLLNYGYNVYKCFDCPRGDSSHVPYDYEGWTSTVIKDTMFCEVISVNWLRHLCGNVVRVMLDYMDQVQFCCKLREVLLDHELWLEINSIATNPRPLKHLCRLKIRKCMGRLHLRCPVFMSFLPLPDRLKDYILYKEYDLFGQGVFTHSW
ncbi:ankyrin repeat and SOCS box 14 isoform X3 [Pelobates cultripes]|uniref:Ankyrin repeat and SOCS box 14 isoform X3 n=1 Tax=Pelobates cultripes TaxID=61616 RepID=A0AAD1WHD7_PELCU|nr:ankyrin repeat and SOCS box 14 isoform X3 [Pelobates cultripes]